MKNTFSINIIFVLLIIVGCSLLPFLSIQIAPSKASNHLTISYDWKGALAEVIEKEVTSKLEGLASTLKGVEAISSTSSKGKGAIQIRFDEHADIKMAKFELNSLIRSSYKKLPEDVSIPLVSEGWSRGYRKEETPLLNYRLVGNGSSHYIQKFAEDFFHARLSTIEGVESVVFYGATPYEWELLYDAEKLENNNLTVNDVQGAVNGYLQEKELGVGVEDDAQGNHTQTYLELKGHKGGTINWDKIPVKKINDRIVYLGDLVTTTYKEQEEQRYTRVNGLNTTNMIIYVEEHVNQIKLAKTIKQKIADLEQNLPQGFSLILARDATEDLVKEIDTISIRIVFSIAMVLVFVFIISRKWRYLFIIVTGLIANICLAFILYYIFDIEIHIYSLAGITVSFGILVDNCILMLDHLRYKKNKKVFLAILAATLTTIGALSIIVFLDDKLKHNLIDFALVIVVNLSVSLVVAFFFIPSLLDKFPLRKLKPTLLFRRKRRIHRFSQRYLKVINFGRRFKKSFITLAIFAFGIPIFWLPLTIEGDTWYATLYNKVFGSETYEDMRPTVNKTLGGAIRLFTEADFIQKQDEDKGRTRLNVNIYMPDGAVIAQTNVVAKKVENFLSQYPEVDRYFTNIYNVENAWIEILFKEAHDNSEFPEFLKNELISLAANIGGCDMSVSGVGQGFSNKMNDAMRSSNLSIRGYNYETILIHARETEKELLKNPRIQKVVINTGRKRYRNKVRNEYVMSLDNELLAKSNSSKGEMLRNLNKLTFDTKNIAYFIFNDEYTPIKLMSSAAKKADIWAVNNELSSRTKLKEVGTLTKKPSEGTIQKLNQEFKVAIEYDFIGSYGLGELILNKTVDSLNANLPLGFKAKTEEFRPWNPKKESQYELVLLVILIIYFICAIVLESLVQPIAIILMIPLSFIGVFLTFSIFEFKFDQGGYAAFLLLCGLVVNASLYIINDYNNLNKQRRKGDRIKNYLKAYNSKIIPIFLTILSTVLGLVPFLFSEHEEQFWFALAAGTIGGLLFSIPVMIFYLPICMFWRGKNMNNKVQIH